MQIKSILAGTALALAATIGSASAADEFMTLDGVTADMMTASELSATAGAGIAIVVDLNGDVTGLGTNNIQNAEVLRGVQTQVVGDQIAILLNITDPFVFVAPDIRIGVP